MKRSRAASFNSLEGYDILYVVSKKIFGVEDRSG